MNKRKNFYFFLIFQYFSIKCKHIKVSVKCCTYKKTIKEEEIQENIQDDNKNKQNENKDKPENLKFIKDNFNNLFEDFYKKVNSDDIEKEYVPIKSGFSWYKNNCWLISVIHSILNISVYQYFIKNTKFDENDELQKRYIILQQCLKTLLDNNNCSYNLDFSKYYELFYEDMVKFNYVEKKKKYRFNDFKTAIFYFLSINMNLVSMVVEGFTPNFYMFKYDKNQFENNKDKILEEYCNFISKTYYFNVLLKKLFGDKIDNFLNNKKNKIHAKWSEESCLIDFICEEKIYENDNRTLLYFFSNDQKIIKTFRENFQNGYKIYNTSKDETEINNAFKFLDDYDYKINSIIYGAEDYHVFNINKDFNKDIYYNLDTYNTSHCGKIDNFLEHLDDKLHYIYSDDKHVYFINTMFITISNK